METATVAKKGRAASATKGDAIEARQEDRSTKKVHFVLQGKGGVGKSYVAALIAQAYMDRERKVVPIDTDPVNKSLGSYEALGVRRVGVMDGATLVRRRFDEMVQMILEEDSHFVVDNGASSFIPLSGYLVENQIAEMIRLSGKQVAAHTVINGGKNFAATVEGFDWLVRNMPPEAEIWVWLNAYFGEITTPDGRSFEDTPVYLWHKERITGVVNFGHEAHDTFGEDVKEMLERNLTFDQTLLCEDFSLVSKQRLVLVKRAIFQQLGRLF